MARGSRGRGRPVLPRLLLPGVVLLAGLTGAPGRAVEAPAGRPPEHSAESRAIAGICAAIAAEPLSGDPHPLPLVASWNTGEVSTGFGPATQIQMIRGGHRLLPWLGLLPPPRVGQGEAPTPSGWATTADALNFAPAARYLAAHRLPLSFESTQWEALLPQVSGEYPLRDAAGHIPPLSPWGAVEPWYRVGRLWARHPSLRRMQQLYPDPPLVLFISNNEHPKLTAAQLGAPYRPGDRAAEAQRRAIGDAWIVRYRALIRGFRDGLEAPGWRRVARFIGYDALVGPAIGRWDGWPTYSLLVPGRIEPWPYAFEGASPSFYVHDWAPDADDILWSPQIEAMNYLPVLEELRRAHRNFWFELSVWDGQEPGRPTDKLRWYAGRGERLTPERYAGMVQFGMWLLRPRVVREFRNPDDDRIRFGPWFEALAAAVDRVHEDPMLAKFWHDSDLVANPAGDHPYQTGLPPDLRDAPRWFLLDAAANPPRPWALDTPLRVYALARERGRPPNREWLIYAFAPRDEELETDLVLPGQGTVRVIATRGGALTHLEEIGGAVRASALRQSSPAASAAPEERSCAA